MKKTAILLTLLIIVTFSCNKKYRFYAFDIEKSVTIEIPFDANEDFEITEVVDLEIDKIFEDESTEADLVDTITIEEIYLSAANYQVFNELELRISAGGVSEIMLANDEVIDEIIDPVTLITSKIKLSVTDNRMDDYVKASKINIKTIAKLDTDYLNNLPAGDTTASVTYNLRFRVQTYVK